LIGMPDDLDIEIRPGGEGVFKPPFTNPAPGTNSVRYNIYLHDDRSISVKAASVRLSKSQPAFKSSNNEREWCL
jgi:hypothetical protein